MSNIMNEWYAKDTSKKVRAVIRAKGMSGKSTCNCPPYGYIKDNDGNWLVEKEAAEIVKRIYRMCIEGYGPMQISKKLNEHNLYVSYIYYIFLKKSSGFT